MSSQTSGKRKHRSRWWWALLAVPVLLVIGWFVIARVYASPEPSAFYDPPSPLPPDPPGTVIRVEDVTAGRSTTKVQRVLYTSTDPEGDPIAVSGVVISPSTPAPSGGWPVLAWAHGTTGIQPPCAPSLEPDAGVARLPELERLVDAGTVVVATDYRGLGTPGTHPYLIGASEGRAVLDAIRATRAVVDDTTETSAIYGHSQGAHAVLYAAELSPSYAPELDLVGAAAMAPPTDLGDLVNRDVNEPLGIILTSLALTSWSTLYSDKVDVATIVHEEARPSVAGVGDRCIGTIGDGAGQAVADLPEVAALEARFLSADPATAAGWSTMLDDNSASGVTIEVPLLVAQGLADELVRPNTTDSFVTQQCDNGSRRLPDVSGRRPLPVRAVAASAVADWLLDRMQGGQPPAGCTRTTG